MLQASDLSGLNKSETDAMQSAIKELKSKVKELQEESSQKDENISDTEQQNSDLSEKSVEGTTPTKIYILQNVILVVYYHVSLTTAPSAG